MFEPIGGTIRSAAVPAGPGGGSFLAEDGRLTADTRPRTPVGVGRGVVIAATTGCPYAHPVPGVVRLRYRGAPRAQGLVDTRRSGLRPRRSAAR